MHEAAKWRCLVSEEGLLARAPFASFGKGEEAFFGHLAPERSGARPLMHSPHNGGPGIGTSATPL